ncbi:MAG: DUF1564 domain-containing protein [Leptospira sp.]|nr:DUF1564 domain-containing protein [Leptospira sp.]
MKTSKTNHTSFNVQGRVFHELSTSSDFYVPENLQKQLERRLSKHKNLRLYLFFLLDQLRSEKFLESLPVFVGTKLKHQEKGQKLVRFRFRPYEKDWTELMIIAKARGGSATLIFVLLLEMDLKEGEKEIPFFGYGIVSGNYLPGKPVKFLQILNLRNGRWKRVLNLGRTSYNFSERASN